ncbi:hypothetical protein AB0L06_07085 [Spirillospora sp. NPDC052269]
MNGDREARVLLAYRTIDDLDPPHACWTNLTLSRSGPVAVPCER